jgi:hypothetical protein
MAHILNRTTKQLLNSINTPDYSEDDWIINPDLSAVENIPVDYWKIEGNSVIGMNESEKEAIDNSKVSSLKAQKLNQLDIDTTSFITSKYSLERQNSLQLLRGDARAEGKTNRFNYIQQVVIWVNSVLEYHYTVVYMINECLTKTEIEQLSWNHAANTLTDPNVFIQTAMEIQD